MRLGVHPASPPPRRPAAFLDRDGVINVDRGYVFRTADLVFTRGAIAGIRLLNTHGYRVLVVTNQSGVARGFYGLDEMATFNRYMVDRLAEAGAHIDAIYCCPYHPDGVVPAFARDHPDRKPKPGMLLRALSDWPTDRDRSFLIGDKESDMTAASAAGVRGIRVPTNDGDLAAIVDAEFARRPVPAGHRSA